MPPTTMLLRLPFPAAQARPCLVRGKPVTRPRHVARAAPANGGSSSSVADRQEQAAPATERPSPASSPPPSPPPPPREPERPEASASSSASPSSPPSPSASSQQAVSSNKALEAERPWRRRLRRAFSALPLSIFTPYANLPADGRTQTLAEEACDPMERNCQVPMHVWEGPCGACAGTGSARSGSAVRAARGRGRARSSFSTTYSTCVACSGVGYVRYTTARLGPPRGLNGRRRRRRREEASPAPLGPLTLARPEADEDADDYIYSDSESDDEENNGNGGFSASYSDEDEGEGS